MLMTQMFPTAEEKVVRSKSQLMGPPASLTPIVLSTFGDDSAVWEHNVLGTEAGDDQPIKPESGAGPERARNSAGHATLGS